MKHDIRHADPRTVAAGALSMLVSDALNGITPNDSRLLSYLAAVGVTEAAAQAAVSRLRGAVRAEAAALTQQPSLFDAITIDSENLETWQ